MDSHLPKVAVILGGGGIRPVSAIPFFAFLESEKIPIDLIVGCSGGSILAAGLASGYTPFQIINDVLPKIKKSTFKLNWKALFSIANLPFGRFDRESALINPDPIKQIFRGFWGDTRLEDLKIKTVIQTTDFQTGEGIGLEKGDLADCVYASSAIYPFLPPIKIGSRWLFDGAYSAPIPILQAINHKADIIIVLDFREAIDGNPKGLFESFFYVSKIDSSALSASQMALSIDMIPSEIIYMKVEFTNAVSFWEIEQFPYIVEAGEKALQKIKNEFLSVYKLKCESK
jgi:NTE family protein